jgi:P-type Ca2+ transporter type 2C
MNDTDQLEGLSSEDAKRRLGLFGHNTLPNTERRSVSRIVVEIVRQPMFALLLGGGVIYALLGEGLDAAVLTLFATLSVSISILQEARSERVLDALRNLASPRALVRRDGKLARIPGSEVVPGDVVVLSEGDRVPADALVLQSRNLSVNESLLTGESQSVSKRAGGLDELPAAPGGDDLPFVFAGSLVEQGSAIALVRETGPRSEMGKIGIALRTIRVEQPKLQRELNWLVRDFAFLGISVAALVVVLSALLRGSWLKAALGGIAIGMSVMPEEIPLVLTVFMTVGAWRISRARVLTRRSAAIEALGSATVLCTDKTGTLTENRMRVVLIEAGGETRRQEEFHSMPPSVEKVLRASWAASAQIPTDAMDRAIQEVAPRDSGMESRVLLRSEAIRPDFFATTNVWRENAGVSLTANTKGAPETIAELCRLPEATKADLLVRVNELAAEGLRLLAVAEATFAARDDGSVPPVREIAFNFLGLIGFADPLRSTVPEAVRECRSAGIRVIMITGDYPATARAIAVQAGVESGDIITGDDLELLSDVDLAERIKSTSVFARIRPAQKLRIVEALKRDGEIVAMTGDGVNDAPAMKAAHIGIAMGGRGTDVAREAASLVLLDDDFASIATTIRLGRRIYDNLRKAIQYIVAVHVPIAGLALLPFTLGLPLMLMPVQIAFLEMVIDPACSIVFESEAEEKDVMRRSPRKPDAVVLPISTALWAVAQGLVALALVATTFVVGSLVRMPEDDLRALVFTVLVLMNLGLILVNRSFHSSLADMLLRPNRALWALLSIVVLVLSISLYWRPAQRLFHFGPLHFDDLAVCAAAGLGLVVLLEFGKRFRDAHGIGVRKSV